MDGAEGERSGAAGGEGFEEYEGPGAWGSWAIGLLLALFLLATGATVHSLLVTLGA